MLETLILLLAAAFAYLAWKNIEKAALVLVAILPLYVLRFSVILPTTLLEAFILILVAVFLIKNWPYYGPRFKKILQGKFKPTNRYPFAWELILWLGVGLAAVAIASFSLPAFGLWRAYFLEPALCFILFVNIFNSKEKIIKALIALAISALGLSVVSVVQYLTGQFIPNEFWAAQTTRRATSIFPFPNAVGLYLAPLIFLFSGLLAFLYKKVKNTFLVFLALAIGASFLAIVFARSEGALFAIAATALVGLFLATKKTRLVAIVILVIGVVGLTISPTFNNYVMKSATLHNYSGEIRRLQWRETMKMLFDGRVITGTGLAGYQAAITPYHQEGMFLNKENLPQNEFLLRVWNDPAYRATHWQPLEIYLYPHNVFLNFWSELGLLGMLLFIWLIGRYFYVGAQTFKTLRAQKDGFAWIVFGLLLAMLAIIIHGLVDVPYFKNDLAVLFWLLFALMGVSSTVILAKARIQA